MRLTLIERMGLAVIIFSGGFQIGEHTRKDFAFNNVKPYLMSKDELSKQFLSAPIPEIDIVVRIEPKENLAVDCGDLNAVACQSGNDPCVVYFPADQVVDFFPHSGTAYWDHAHNGETLAHEFLHCIYGNWHQPFTDAHPTRAPATTVEHSK